MDFNLNDEQELFVAGIRELMASENWEAYFAECDRDSVYPGLFSSKHWRIWVSTVC
ncbi:hypothetical protein ACLB1M_03660 [Escherichia coli]